MKPLDDSAPWPQWRLVRAYPPGAAGTAGTAGAEEPPGAGPSEDDLRVLGEEERRRVAMLRRETDRRMYVVAHAALRRLLGGYLGRDPAALDFVREPCPDCGAPNGRPALPGNPLHFSLSHSDGLALLAFADRPVGVDLEPLPAQAVIDDVTGALHPDERTALTALPEAARRTAFARCWTRKEAVLKAQGTGLGHGGAGRLRVGTGPRPDPLPGWTVTDLQAPGGYAAACAVACAVDAGPSNAQSPSASSVRQHR